MNSLHFFILIIHMHIISFSNLAIILHNLILIFILVQQNFGLNFQLLFKVHILYLIVIC